MTKDEALKQALDALAVATTPLAEDRRLVLKAIAACREALEQKDEQEPALWKWILRNRKEHAMTAQKNDLVDVHVTVTRFTTYSGTIQMPRAKYALLNVRSVSRINATRAKAIDEIETLALAHLKSEQAEVCVDDFWIEDDVEATK